jgi:ribose-phosphate pyrophosphokinase
MKTFRLDLDTSFTPHIMGVDVGIPYNRFIHSGGEVHIRLAAVSHFIQGNKVIVTQRVKSSEDFMKLVMAKNALDVAGVREVELLMPYLPYARQDRVCNVGEAFSLKAFSSLLNSLNFSSVRILDAHSDVGPALINNCVTIPNTSYVRKASEHIISQGHTNLLLVSPDSGAHKKNNKLFVELRDTFSGLVKCDKVRDLSTGDITGTEVFADDLQGKPCLIVDDICDGGRTFLGVSQELKRKGCGTVFLYITHGIFSSGFSQLEEHFHRIYTTDSFSNVHNPLVMQLGVSLC